MTYSTYRCFVRLCNPPGAVPSRPTPHSTTTSITSGSNPRKGVFIRRLALIEAPRTLVDHKSLGFTSAAHWMTSSRIPVSGSHGGWRRRYLAFAQRNRLHEPCSSLALFRRRTLSTPSDFYYRGRECSEPPSGPDPSRIDSEQPRASQFSLARPLPGRASRRRPYR